MNPLDLQGILSLLAGALMIGWLIAGSFWCWNLEKATWNSGTCAQCGAPWIQFDTDSQGGRGYRCAHGHGCWISYPVDKS